MFYWETYKENVWMNNFLHPARENIALATPQSEGNLLNWTKKYTCLFSFTVVVETRKTIAERQGEKFWKDEQRDSMCLLTRIASRYLAAFFDCQHSHEVARPQGHSVLESVDWPTRCPIKAIVQSQSTGFLSSLHSHDESGHSQLADGVVSAPFALSRRRLSAKPAWLQQPPEREYGRPQKRKPTVRFPSTYFQS